MAVVNDTVGTMMTCGFDDQRCEVGIIIGKDAKKISKKIKSANNELDYTVHWWKKSLWPFAAFTTGSNYMLKQVVDSLF